MFSQLANRRSRVDFCIELGRVLRASKSDVATGYRGRIGKSSWSKQMRRRLQWMFGSTKGITQVADKQQIDRSVVDNCPIAEEKPVNLAAMSDESGPEGCWDTGLGDLPLSSIESILSLTTPRDVARLACVNCCFRAASRSNVVWQEMLPSFYADILAEALNAPPETASKKEVYNFLCNRVLLRNGTRDLWLDRATGKVCQSVGARNLGIIWGSDESYWKWCSDEGARFSEVAYLKIVWWLEVKGEWECKLSPGTYTFYWRLCLRQLDDQQEYNRDYGSIGPVTFSFEASGNEPVNTVCHLTRQGARRGRSSGQGGDPEGREPLGYRWDRGMRWIELDVGEFVVDSENSPFDIAFYLKDVDCSRAKYNLHIDGVGIRPSCTIKSRIPLSSLDSPTTSYPVMTPFTDHVMAP